MAEIGLQELCEKGQLELMQTRYVDAAKTLACAEHQAWSIRDFDTLSRLYLPLQEARRQIRQRCGEGAVRLHLLADSIETPQPPGLLEVSHGQLLIAGWGSIQPAIQIRKSAAENSLYLETFLAAAYPVMAAKTIVAIIPTADGSLPEPTPRGIGELISLLPSNSLILHPEEIPADADKGTSESFAGVMALWERLHTPFLRIAENQADPINRMQAYRKTLEVDPGCELAHQFLADTARKLARAK